VALLSGALTANAADWELYAQGGDTAIFVATDRITRNGDYVETWQKDVSTKARLVNKKSYAYAISQITVYCNPAGFAMRIHSITYYSKSGQSVDAVSGEGPWKSLVPDSIGEGMAMRVCRQ